MELLKKYMYEGDTTSALLVGQNLFNKNRSNHEIFSLYYSLLLDTAKSNVHESDKYIRQLITVLSIYSENVDINEEEVKFIRDCENKLSVVVSKINKMKEEKKVEVVKKIVINNSSLLKSANDLIVKLENASNRDIFKSILKNIYDLDTKFDKDNFISIQKAEYEDVTAKCQKVVDFKLKQFDRIDNIDYNNRAIASYEKIFNCFKNAKDEYKEKEILELFSYDASRLTNETLIYYNHVYNYILSKLNDEQKFTITKLSIKAEKRK